MAEALARGDAQQAIIRRYADGYRVARATEALANAIKIVGVVLGVTTALGVMTMLETAAGFLGGLVFGGAVGVGVFCVGVIAAAHGQVLKATLDSAINSSPFLTNDDRIE